MIVIAGASGFVGSHVLRALKVLLDDDLPLRQAVNLTAKIVGGKKNELYRLALELKKGRE